MKNILCSHFFPQTKIHFFLIFTSLFFCFPSSFVAAQTGLSTTKFNLLKERSLLTDQRQDQIPPEKFLPAQFTESGSGIANTGNLDPTFNTSVTDGDGFVYETAIQTDGKIIVVGTFTRAGGVRVGNIARFNADGSFDSGFNNGGSGANFPISAVALQADGKILIGGNFTIYNGQTISRLARLNTDGSLDPTFTHNLTFSGQIYDIVVQPNGKITIAGAFNAASGPLRGRIIRLNADGTVDSSFNNNGGASSTVYKVLYTPDGKILIGGAFTFYASQPARSIARLNEDGSLDTSFNPGTGGNGIILNIIVQPDGKIITSGEITAFNGTLTDGVVRLTASGAVETVFNITDDPNIGYIGIQSLALQSDGKILVGYILGLGVATYTSGVLRFNADASPDNNFSFGEAEGFVIRDINLLPDGKFLTGGQFVAYQGQTHLRLARVNSDGIVDNSFNPAISTNGVIYAIERQSDGKILVAGDFEFVNGQRRSKIVRLNPDGSIDNTFNIGDGFYLGSVFTLTLKPDGKILAGGTFATYNSVVAPSLVEINPDGSFSQLFSIVDFIPIAVLDLAIQTDGKIVISGQIFQQSGNLSIVARYHSNGTPDTSFTGPSVPASGYAVLIQPTGKIIVGGTFTSNANFPRNGIARLNINGSLDSGFSGFPGQVFALEQESDGKILFGGSGTSGRFTSEGVLETNFNAGGIRTIKSQPDGKILLGGNFGSYNGTPVNSIIRINYNGTLDSSFPTSTGTSGIVLALNLQPDGKILVGGQFSDFNNTEKFSLVRLQGAAALHRAPFDFDGDGKTDVSIFRPAGGEWWYSRSSDGQVPAAQFGSGTDKPVPADYTGDGRADIAFWQPSTGFWFILRSEDGSFFAFPFGQSGDIPAPADFDGDGKADPAVFRPALTTWFISLSSGGNSILQFGASEDFPVTGDYDGDGKADIAVFRPSDGSWWILRSSNGSTFSTAFGNSNDKPVSADYTGDGRTDIAVWRPATGEWYILRSEDASYFSVPFGAMGDIPVAGDYDGDGKTDFAVFRPSAATWYVNRTTAGLMIQQFGLSSDFPVPSAYVP